MAEPPECEVAARVETVVGAIRAATTLRLVYENKKKAGVVSMHEVAPVDLRLGDTAATRANVYLWAWCFAEDKPETHLMDRVLRIADTGTLFEADDILDQWVKHWPLPAEWVVPREW